MSMRLSDERISQFQQMYLNQFSVEIDQTEAVKRGTLFALLVAAVYKPISQKELNEILKNQSETNLTN